MKPKNKDLHKAIALLISIYLCMLFTILAVPSFEKYILYTDGVKDGYNNGWTEGRTDGWNWCLSKTEAGINIDYK